MRRGKVIHAQRDASRTKRIERQRMAALRCSCSARMLVGRAHISWKSSFHFTGSAPLQSRVSSCALAESFAANESEMAAASTPCGGSRVADGASALRGSAVCAPSAARSTPWGTAACSANSSLMLADAPDVATSPKAAGALYASLAACAMGAAAKSMLAYTAEAEGGATSSRMKGV